MLSQTIRVMFNDAKRQQKWLHVAATLLVLTRKGLKFLVWLFHKLLHHETDETCACLSCSACKVVASG